MTQVSRILDARVEWATFDPRGFRDPGCPICLSSDCEVQAGIVINGYEFALVECRYCNLIRRAPMPDPGHFESLYSARYYAVDVDRPESDAPTELELQVGIRDFTEAHHQSRETACMLEVERWLDEPRIRKPGETGRAARFLEIGGGRGYLQQAARAKGWETVGVEISPHAIQAAISKGLMVLPIPIEKLASDYVPRSHFDLIAFFDFLEHVTDPARSLRIIRELLTDDGTIIFRIPILVGDQRPSLHLIDHLWHFSNATLRALLSKEGFDVYFDSPSGRFDDPRGGARFIQNWTYYAGKAG